MGFGRDRMVALLHSRRTATEPFSLALLEGLYADQDRDRQRRLHEIKRANHRGQRGSFRFPVGDESETDDESEYSDDDNPFAARRSAALPVTNPFARPVGEVPFGQHSRGHPIGGVRNPFDKLGADPFAQMSFGRGPDTFGLGDRSQQHHPQPFGGPSQAHADEQMFPWSRAPSTSTSDSSTAPKTMREAFAQFVTVTTDTIPGATISKVVSSSWQLEIDAEVTVVVVWTLPGFSGEANLPDLARSKSNRGSTFGSVE